MTKKEIIKELEKLHDRNCDLRDEIKSLKNRIEVLEFKNKYGSTEEVIKVEEDNEQ